MHRSINLSSDPWTLSAFASAAELRAFAARYDLTEKEREALSLILRGISTKEMATSMGISGKGVEFHITKILRKTSIKKRRDIFQAYTDWKR